MNKIKKIFISFCAFFMGLVSKVFATGLVETKYGIIDPTMVETKYGILEPETTIGERILSVGKLALPIILFFIGLFVVLSKKITKKSKAIVISFLVILAILGYIFMNYIATNLRYK